MCRQGEPVAQGDHRGRVGVASPPRQRQLLPVAVIPAAYQTAAVEQAVAHPADRQQLVLVPVRYPERASQGRELVRRVPLAETRGDLCPSGGRIEEQVQEPVELA